MSPTTSAAIQLSPSSRPSRGTSSRRWSAFHSSDACTLQPREQSARGASRDRGVAHLAVGAAARTDDDGTRPPRRRRPAEQPGARGTRRRRGPARVPGCAPPRRPRAARPAARGGGRDRAHAWETSVVTAGAGSSDGSLAEAAARPGEPRAHRADRQAQRLRDLARSSGRPRRRAAAPRAGGAGGGRPRAAPRRRRRAPPLAARAAPRARTRRAVPLGPPVAPHQVARDAEQPRQRVLVRAS